MIDLDALRRAVRGTPLEEWASTLEGSVDAVLTGSQDARLPQWRGILDSLPSLVPSRVDLDSRVVRVGLPGDCDDRVRAELEGFLRSLHPWRKGPYEIFGIHIDTEWRSDWKWDRVSPHIESLQGRTVLDVGCGNGYHCRRMAGAGASLVVGLDPYLVFVMQFLALNRFIRSSNVFLLPLGIEAMPPGLGAFDTVFSMGVLYHRRSPMDHLLELRSCLRPGGELVLETLVVDGEEGRVLVPPGRYAKMRNVWFVPSPPTLEGWLKRCGYRDVRLVDVNRTSTEEQRSTSWMTFESLPQYLDPKNPSLTVEGHPAPRRAIFLARSP